MYKSNTYALLSNRGHPNCIIQFNDTLEIKYGFCFEIIKAKIKFFVSQTMIWQCNPID